MLTPDLKEDLGHEKEGKRRDGRHAQGKSGRDAFISRHPPILPARPALRQSPIDPAIALPPLTRRGRPRALPSGSHRAGYPAFPAASGAGLDGYRSRCTRVQPWTHRRDLGRSICTAARPHRLGTRTAWRTCPGRLPRPGIPEPGKEEMMRW